MADIRLIAASEDGIGSYHCTAYDGHSGQNREFECSPKQLAAILAIMLDPDGTPKGHEDMYALVELLFEGWPMALRPIP